MKLLQELLELTEAYNDSGNLSTKEKALIGWWVFKNDKRVAGPFKSESEAKGKLSSSKGDEVGYVSDYDAKRILEK